MGKDAGERKTRSDEGGKKGTVMRIRRERLKKREQGKQEREGRKRAGGRITREIQKRGEGNGLYQAARWSTFRFFPSLLLSSFFHHLLPIRTVLSVPSFSLDPSLIVFHSFLRPFHFVTVRVPSRPCETFAVPHGWAG